MLREARLRARDSPRADEARTPESDVTADRFSELALRRERVAEVVGGLVRASEVLAERTPRGGVGARRDRAHRRRGLEEGGGLRVMVRVERRRRLALPGLAANDSARRPRRLGERLKERAASDRALRDEATDALEREDDQRVADEDGERLAEGAVNRRNAATRGGVVEARQIVVDE